jgi:hypothetical protein
MRPHVAARPAPGHSTSREAGPISDETVSVESAGAAPVGHGQVSAEPVSAEPVSAEPVSAEPVSAEPVSAETVRALYLALLNREPDPEGLEFWTKATSVEEVVRSLSDTDEHQQRVQLLAQAAAGGAERDLTAGEVAVRLEAGDGLVSLDDRQLFLEALGTMPWSEVEGDPVWVLGPYGRQLADELVGRGCAPRSYAGLSGPGRAEAPVRGERGLGAPEALVLTEEPYVVALTRLRPAVTGGRLRMLMHPVSAVVGTPADDVQRAVQVARQRLHRLGFIEVSQVFARRHGGGTVVVDRSYTTPEVGRLHGRPGPQGDIRAPRSVWLVGRRVPAQDRS